jgi:hypothetical protein
MGILDEGTFFGNNRSIITGATGTSVLSNVIDMSMHDHSKGRTDLWFIANVSTAAASAGAATAQLHLVSDDAAALATDGSATYHFSTGPIPVASLVAGFQVCCVLLPPGKYERYLGVLMTVGTSTFSAGKLDMFLTAAPHTKEVYAAARH